MFFEKEYNKTYWKINYYYSILWVISFMTMCPNWSVWHQQLFPLLKELFSVLWLPVEHDGKWNCVVLKSIPILD